MKKLKRNTRGKTLFYNIFIGEYVEIVTKSSIELSEASETGTLVSKTPLVFSGFVVDLDDTHLFIGPMADAVSQAVVRSEIIAISVTAPEAPKTVSEEDKKNFN